MAAPAAAAQAAVPLSRLRAVTRVVQGMVSNDGAGVKIMRTVGSPKLRNLDPFLMLDELKLPLHQATAGFPDHPHRGFSTCSIMLSGEMQHKDSAGNSGVIGPGGVQWMTAGRGIIHSEMPVGRGEEELHGFQLWINLPRSHKMMKPRYQDYQAADIPSVAVDGGRVRVLSGTFGGARGPIRSKTPTLILDVALAPGAAPLAVAVPEGFNAFAYVHTGEGSLSGEAAPHRHAVVLGDGDHVTAAAAAAPGGGGGGFGFLLIAGRPINEPIVQHGPFVMNTQEEIMQAFMDYQGGRLHNPEDDVWAPGDDSDEGGEL